MTIELEQARGLLARAVLTQGEEFIYNPGGAGIVCEYKPFGKTGPQSKTGCLIGVALDLAGETRHHHVSGNVISLSMRFPDMFSREVVRYFGAAQDSQDLGKSWGMAYKAAEDSLKFPYVR